jgi:hypothetical protein
MPLQKNSGNKKSKRETGIVIKNRRFIADMLWDYRKEGKIDGLYIGRVTRKLGNGRVDVFYVAKEMGDDGQFEYNSYEKQATIKGSFRGKGKRSMWIDIGSAVAISDNGLNMLEICAVLTRDQLKEIAEEVYVDPRVLNGVQDGDSRQEDGIEFDNEAEEEDVLDEDIDKI